MSSIMTAKEKARAKAMGVDKYFRGKRFRTLRDEHIYTVLDQGVTAMKASGVTSPNGKILGALASTLVQSDEKSIGDLQNRKITAVTDGTPEEWTEFFELLGFEIAERYLAARKGKFSKETPIMSPESLVDKLEGVLAEMQARGQEMALVSALPDEMAVTPADAMPDPVNVGRAILEGVAGSYQLLVPPVGEDGELPNAVEESATAKAAFLRLSVDDLVELAAAEGMTDLPTKSALVKALADRYADDLDKVAELTLRETATEAGSGLTTRLLPLSAAPDVKPAHEGFASLCGRYFEIRPTVFFVYRSATLSPDGQFLTIEGSIRSFFVSPVEFTEKRRLNPRPRKDDVKIRLQENQKWAMVESARASDMPHIGAILRRSGAVKTSGAVPAPDPLSVAPYAAWDARSLWMLDLIRRDLQAPELLLQETLMANFDSPKGTDPTEEENEDEEKVKPRLASVRLKGRKLQDHPEVCARIVNRAHMKDVEFRLRKVTDKQHNIATLTAVRFAWERDHLAVMTGAVDDKIDGSLHRLLVRLVRDAVDRPLSSELVPILKNIEKRSKETDVDADAKGVFTEEEPPTPPEPAEGQISVSAATPSDE
jgi:hypothetical protein